MKRWFADLEPRERFILSGGAAIAALIIVRAIGLITHERAVEAVTAMSLIDEQHE